MEREGGREGGAGREGETARERARAGAGGECVGEDLNDEMLGDGPRIRDHDVHGLGDMRR